MCLKDRSFDITQENLSEHRNNINENRKGGSFDIIYIEFALEEKLTESHDNIDDNRKHGWPNPRSSMKWDRIMGISIV